MTYSNTPAQQAVRDNMRESLSNALVSKALRSKALSACKKITNIERRTHAYAFVLFRGRSCDELERFIKSMGEE